MGTDAPRPLDSSALDLDCAAETARIQQWMTETLPRMHKRGVVLGLSGGVDSSVCAALAVRALGPNKVFGLMMPETDSSPTSAARGGRVAEQLRIRHETVNIGPALEALGCYRERDDAIRVLFPAYGAGWASKIAIAGGAMGGVNFFKLVVQSPAGNVDERRLPIREYLRIVAATNYKQRLRKTVEYCYADKLNYAVIGTPNRLEYDQGFFVKNGDGAADLKPIAHLYKTQVYALARFLELPADVVGSTPTTDTYSMQQGQDEFYFTLPYAQMDLALWAHNHGVPAAELAAALGLSVDRAEYVYSDIAAKRRATAYLHASPSLVTPVSEVGG
ncbi:MAG TPA: NAD(+) synthase [Gemmatimonadaceae bacterium]|nr:NAD(+) synthase [Gemmatimonadaceae bacterium]